MKYIGVVRAIFIANKMKEELVYNMAKSEGNSLSFAETASVMQGISVGGKKMYELRQIEHIKAGWDEIISQVKNGSFEVSKENFIHINTIVAEDDNNELGGFRNLPVRIGGTKWMPPLPMLLNDSFKSMLEVFNNENLAIEERVCNLFLESARSQFFADGNKRTAQLIMNGVLMQRGYSLFSISPEEDAEYKEKLVAFYESGDAEEIKEFMGKLAAQIDLRFDNLFEQKLNILEDDGLSDEQREDAVRALADGDSGLKLG
ncbi:MAG: hypothetical protein QG567_2024 [Campylobacterota bacterium]|nr:hypothetical protein [Campylobacterota bacterium]